MGRETLKAMWLEHWLQIGKSQSLGRGLGHSTETLVSEAVRTDSFRGFVRFGLVSWEVLFPTIQPLRFYLFSVGATTASHSSDLCARLMLLLPEALGPMHFLQSMPNPNILRACHAEQGFLPMRLNCLQVGLQVGSFLCVSRESKWRQCFQTVQDGSHSSDL